MNQENEALLNQGISAVRGGNKREGARILAQVVRVEPQSADAWFWLAAATDQPGEAKACLDRVLKLNPNHPRARQALELINQSGGSMPPTSAFTGEAGPSAFGAPPAPPNRPLSTGELLSTGGYQDPYGAPPAPPPSPYGSNNFPPPPPFGASNAPTAAVPPPPFGAPAVSNEAMPPPPPFGAPAWAQDQQGGNFPRPSAPGDPYGGGATATIPTAVPPPPMGNRPGLSFGQLDPAAAAAAQANAVAEQANAQIYDPGAEIRRSLLGDPPAPPPGAIPPNSTVPPPPVKAKEKTPRKGNRRLLLIIVAAAVLIFAVLGALALARQNNTTITPGPTEAELTSTAVAALPATSPTATLATTNAATTPSVAATTAANANATTAVATTEVPTTAAPQTTAPVATTPAVATPTPQAATVARPNTPTAGASQPTPTRGAAVTIVPPSRAPTIAGGSQIPPAVQQYVNQANDLINQMAFVEGQINTLIVDRYKKGDFSRGAVISKSYEVSFFTLLMGQLAAQFRELNPPAEAKDLNQVGLDYASDIRESGVSIDTFFDTGRISYLEDLSNYMSKAAADRTKWFQAIQTYPFKVNF